MTPEEIAPENDGARLSLPTDLVKSLRDRIRGSAFPSVEAFVLFVLARLAEATPDEPFSAEEERQLKERLRSLGYID
jgi:hypothetical protein